MRGRFRALPLGRNRRSENKAGASRALPVPAHGTRRNRRVLDLGRVRRHTLPRLQDALAPEGRRCSPTASPSRLQDVGSVYTIHLAAELSIPFHLAPAHPQGMSGRGVSHARQAKHKVQILMSVQRGAIHKNRKSREDGSDTVRFQNQEKTKARRRAYGNQERWDIHPRRSA